MKRGDTVYSDTVAQVLGSLSLTLLQKFDDCLKSDWAWRKHVTPCRWPPNKRGCSPGLYWLANQP
jgi:hypothetical protein